jgi:hypothetical protein
VYAQGPYGIKFTAVDGEDAQLFCVDMAFTITPPHANAIAADDDVLVGLGAAEELPAPRRFGEALGGAVRRDALGELRAAFEAADAAARRGESGDGSSSGADATAVL